MPQVPACFVTLGRITMTLFYATDFADRLENEIIPALRAGFIVLTDRYIFSLMARALVRGADPDWIKQVYEFALKPDVVIYLRVGLDDLITRIVQSTGFFRNKAKNIKAASQQLVEQHGGEVPRDLDALVALAGVGRKTANVVLGTAHGYAVVHIAHSPLDAASGQAL